MKHSVILEGLREMKESLEQDAYFLEDVISKLEEKEAEIRRLKENIHKLEVERKGYKESQPSLLHMFWR